MSTPPNQQSEEYLAARLESCRLLGLDPDDLSPHEAIRADLATVLRLWLDGSQSTLLAGGSADPVKLLSVVEALTKLVPEAEHKSGREDPREHMWRTYLEMRRRGELGDRAAEPSLRAQIDQLRAENERLRAVLGSGSTAAIMPPTCDIVPPGERAECNPGMRPGPDDPRPPVVIEAKAVRTPPPPAPQPQAAPTYDYNTNSEWKDYVNSDGSIRSTPRGVGSFSGKDWGPVG
jgi:hypothetical protein